MKVLNEMAENGFLPDKLIRFGIRQLDKRRLQEEDHGDRQSLVLEDFIAEMRRSPIAIKTEKANEQHYEVPSDFFLEVLGRYSKYSCAYWPGQVGLLDEAEEEALRLTCEHAGIVDGMDILELGCGWGSATLWIAEQYPRSRVLAVSNSASGSRIRSSAKASC